MEDIKSGRKKRGRKKHVLLKLFLALIALILVAAIAGGSYLYRLMGSFNYNEAGHKNNVYVDESNLFSSKDVTNILFLGVDRRNADEKSRSDTMMMLSIDRATKSSSSPPSCAIRGYTSRITAMQSSTPPAPGAARSS